MTDDIDQIRWPDEVWLAELAIHHNGWGECVFSEHATVPRFEGCPQTDREFARYVHEGIVDSALKYAAHQRDAIIALEAERDKLTKALIAARSNLYEIEAGDMSPFEAIDEISVALDSGKPK